VGERHCLLSSKSSVSGIAANEVGLDCVEIRYESVATLHGVEPFMCRSHPTASNRLNGPTLEAGARVFQAGDRILCRSNSPRLDVLNGDLGTVTAVHPHHSTIPVRLDRDPETRGLPDWYLDQDHIDYGYALTGHKAQGATTENGRTLR